MDVIRAHEIETGIYRPQCSSKAEIVPAAQGGGKRPMIPATANLEFLRDGIREGRVVVVIGLVGRGGGACSTGFRGLGNTHFPSVVRYGWFLEFRERGKVRV